MAQKTIKNIIFDYGNVIINLDIAATFRAFEQIGAVQFTEDWGKIMAAKLFHQFERGDISVPDFRTELRKSFNKEVSDQEIDWAWNQILKDMPVPRIALLKNIRPNYRTFILSNSNEIHYDHYTNDLKKTHHLDNFDHLVEKAYFSYQVNLIKPEPEFYHLLLDNHNLNPEETLFIDDLKHNIDGASALGLNTLWLTPEMDICDLFDENHRLNKVCFSKMNLD
jgi:glucose-1-phosphatase